MQRQFLFILNFCISGMEFACSQAPSRMQGAVMGFYYFCTGIGSFLGIAVLRVFEQIFKVFISNPTVTVDINKAKLYYYFFLLAIIQLITVIIFIPVSKTLKVRKLPNVTRSGSDVSNNAIRS